MFDIAATVSLFGKAMSQTQFVVTGNSLSFKLWVDYYVIRGQVALNAWSNETGFHFTGQGSLTLVLPKGLFVNERWLTFPPKDLDLANVDTAVGEFTNGAWGFRGKGVRLEVLHRVLRGHGRPADLPRCRSVQTA